VPDFKSNGLEFAAQLMIPKTQHFDAFFREKAVSLFIPGAPIRIAVSASIEFDCQLCDGAIEIEEVNATGVLATEFEFVEAMVTK
jgi:hypothetical protein